MSVVKTQDVCGDGGLLKRVLKASAESHRTPRLGARVKIRYEGSLASCGTRFDSGRAEFHTGEAQVITAWDKGVATMRKGELAVFVCRADYAFGESGKPPQVPPDAAVKYEIELLSYQEPTRELWEMSPADKLEEALRLKAAGTAEQNGSADLSAAAQPNATAPTTVRARPGRLSALRVHHRKYSSHGLLYGRAGAAGRLTAKNGGC